MCRTVDASFLDVLNEEQAVGIVFMGGEQREYVFAVGACEVVAKPSGNGVLLVCGAGYSALLFEFLKCFEHLADVVPVFCCGVGCPGNNVVGGIAGCAVVGETRCFENVFATYGFFQ